MAASVIATADIASEDALGVHLVTLGCARNEVDSEELAGRLAAGGFRLVGGAGGRRRGAGQHLRLHRGGEEGLGRHAAGRGRPQGSGRPQAVVAVGCLAERYGRELAEALPEADAVLGFDDYPDIADRLRRSWPGSGTGRARAPGPAPAAAAGARRPPGWRPRVAVPGHRATDLQPTGTGQRTARYGAGWQRRRRRRSRSPPAATGAARFCAIPAFRGAYRVPARRPRSSPRRAGWSSRASARSSWSARTPPPTARTWAISGSLEQPAGRALGRRRASSGSGCPTCSRPRCGPSLIEAMTGTDEGRALLRPVLPARRAHGAAPDAPIRRTRTRSWL